MNEQPADVKNSYNGYFMGCAITIVALLVLIAIGLSAFALARTSNAPVVGADNSSEIEALRAEIEELKTTLTPAPEWPASALVTCHSEDAPQSIKVEDIEWMCSEVPAVEPLFSETEEARIAEIAAETEPRRNVTTFPAGYPANVPVISTEDEIVIVVGYTVQDAQYDREEGPCAFIILDEGTYRLNLEDAGVYNYNDDDIQAVIDEVIAEQADSRYGNCTESESRIRVWEEDGTVRRFSTDSIMETAERRETEVAAAEAQEAPVAAIAAQGVSDINGRARISNTNTMPFVAGDLVFGYEIRSVSGELLCADAPDGRPYLYVANQAGTLVSGAVNPWRDEVIANIPVGCGGARISNTNTMPFVAGDLVFGYEIRSVSGELLCTDAPDGRPYLYVANQAGTLKSGAINPFTGEQTAIAVFCSPAQ